ncbi:endonuclease, partial [Streptococcus suis]
TGVSYYKTRQKYRARIKISQRYIHLGYYDTFLEATQASNVGIELLFGEYGRYKKDPELPKWIRKKVEKISNKFNSIAF